MTAQPPRPERSGPETDSVTDLSPFKPSLVKAVFRDVTPMHLSRSAAWAAASVIRTVLTEIIDGARRAAAAEGRKKLVPGDLLAALDRNAELEVGNKWYDHSPTFRGLTGVLYDAEGVIVPSRKRSRSRKPSAVVGAHRFEAGVKKLLRSQGATAAPAMVRDLDGIASVFLTDLARDAAVVTREGGVARFGTAALVMSGEPVPAPFLNDSLRAPSARKRNGRTIGRDDVLAATTMQLFGGNLRQRALTKAREATQDTSAD
ncbi:MULTISPECIES: hypothetical protein [unclassified Streptomyces]|uniref:hypothetical protein n=1 Tax=unclassified Streptomyces TaxID=2593676 RepID=UPI0001C1C6F1|nr:MULTISPECIES: hypothetical protein [unclassified Streptomyces]AEN08019.1 conserved hypothetical protein [Streptomyces sp. SirexAA-E]MYR65492.1 hypothetical protein [Streptomyces sp. SID4939]MYR98956.1 hypothetical protein [Streptomyces sp. SID4940]MYT62085.1 hypothetical protein [Streptomyces sp. SID8357]MYT88270.1 hypothetical protein [Streptomyces sp. SID8360]